MNRRGFLGSIAAFAAACAIDPELALWKPGAKTISVPKPMVFGVDWVIGESRTAYYPIQFEAFGPGYIFIYDSSEPSLKFWPPIVPTVREQLAATYADTSGVKILG